MKISPDVLGAIGNTPLIQLRNVVHPGGARIVAKLEGANPTGSMKDRMARAMIEAAEHDGTLRPGGTVIEFTGGSTGTSLAMVCAAKGYRLLIVTSNATSLEKRTHMKALGAELTVLHSEGARVTNELFKALVSTTEKLVSETGGFWTNQFRNQNQASGYYALGEEIWDQTGGRVDGFATAVGTCGSLKGVATILRRRNPRIHVVAVEPAESPVLSGGQSGAHRIEGVGVGQIPFLWDPSLVSSIEKVSTADAEVMARRLAREEGIFAGTSSGANVVAAVRLAEKLGPDATVATLLVDHGLKYLSVDVFT